MRQAALVVVFSWVAFEVAGVALSGRRRPSRLLRRSARWMRRLAGLRRPVVVCAFVLLTAWTAALTGLASFMYLLYIAVSLVLGAIGWSTLVWMLYAWRTPDALADGRLAAADVDTAHSFSLIVPARHEEAVLATTLSRLVTSDHPAFEVLVVVGADDDGTREVAERVAQRHPDRVKVVVDDTWPKNKPRALNAALPYCTGTIVGVFDAEDDVHPELLRRVDLCFQRTDADVVQGGVQLMNFRSSWITVRNVLEYYFWFRSRLHFHAAQGFIPLGGNTVFVRSQILRAVSGWDPDCLAEDCELGVRLSALGAHTVVVYEPEFVTREECPPTVRAFVRQRTRWSQGYLQTLSRGYWRRLPRRERAFGAYILSMPYLLALAWLMIPVAIGTAVTVKAPVGVTLISFVPALPMVCILAAETVGLGEFCRAYDQRASPRDYLRLVLGLPLYHALLAFAAARAVVRELRGARGWEKTAHLGLHLALLPDETPAVFARRGQPASALAVHAEASPSRGLDDLYGNGGREPLWVRLHGVSADGAASLTLPGLGAAGLGAAGLAAAGRRELRNIGERLRRAVAAHPDLGVQLLLAAGVTAVAGTNMLHWPGALFDEGIYVGNAWAVQHGALAPYTYGYGHPPLAWLLIFLWTWSGGVLGLGGYSIDATRGLMLVVNLVSCQLVYALARRLGMGRAFAAAAVLLFGLSPVGVFFHRGVLLDNVAIAWVLAAFVLASTPRRNLWALAGSGACFAAGVLSKETTLVLLPPLMLTAWHNSDTRTRRYCLTLFASLFTAVAFAYPLYATLKGELVPGKGHVSLLGEEVVQLFGRQTNGSVLDPHSIARATVQSWLTLDPLLLAAAVAAAPVALLRRATRPVALAYLIGCVMVLRPGYLPAMYVIALLPFAALVVAGSADALWRAQRRSRFPRVGAVLTATALGTMLFIVGPKWVRGDHTAMTVRLDNADRAAERWLVRHIGHDARLIVTDHQYIYLLNHGFDASPVKGGFFSRTVVSYWPLDYDPAVQRYFKGGWRAFDYIISTQPMRDDVIHPRYPGQTPITLAALEHSRVVKTFGAGDARIEVRAIDQGQARW